MPLLPVLEADAQPRRRRGLNGQYVVHHRRVRHGRCGCCGRHAERDGLGRVLRRPNRPAHKDVPGWVGARSLQVHAQTVPDGRQCVVRRAAVARARRDHQPGRRSGLHGQRVGVHRVLRDRRCGRGHRERDGLLKSSLRRSVHRPLREGVPGRVRCRGRQVDARAVREAGHRVVRRPALARVRSDNDSGRRRGLDGQHVVRHVSPGRGCGRASGNRHLLARRRVPVGDGVEVHRVSTDGETADGVSAALPGAAIHLPLSADRHCARRQQGHRRGSQCPGSGRARSSNTGGRSN